LIKSRVSLALSVVANGPVKLFSLFLRRQEKKEERKVKVKVRVRVKVKGKVKVKGESPNGKGFLILRRSLEQRIRGKPGP